MYYVCPQRQITEYPSTTRRVERLTLKGFDITENAGML